MGVAATIQTPAEGLHFPRQTSLEPILKTEGLWKLYRSGKVEVPEHSLDFPIGEVARLAGLHIDSTEVEAVLGRLGFSATAHGGSLSIQLPSWRGGPFISPW